MDSDIDDDVDLDAIFEEPTPPTAEETQADETVEEGAAAAVPAVDAARFSALEAKIAELKGAGDANGKIDDLLEMGRMFLQKQGQPAAPAVDTDASMEAFGKTLQDTLLTKPPKEAAQFLLSTFNEISQNNVNNALRQHGAPLADKAGDYATQTFLSRRRDDAGPNGEKMHKAIVKEFGLTPQEKSWVATASSDQTAQFLDRKYTEAAGKVLLKSSSRAKPKDIGGGTNGSGGGSNVTTFPGLDQRQERQIQQLATAYWPDPKVRAEKIKGLRASMLAETGS